MIYVEPRKLQMNRIATTAAPQHNSERLITVLEARNEPLDWQGACGKCFMKLRPGDSVTALRDEEGFLLVHERCTGWDEPLSREELETAFDEIFHASAAR